MHTVIVLVVLAIVAVALFEAWLSLR